jgi:hypothetical protein
LARRAGDFCYSCRADIVWRFLGVATRNWRVDLIRARAGTVTANSEKEAAAVAIKQVSDRAGAPEPHRGQQDQQSGRRLIVSEASK